MTLRSADVRLCWQTRLRTLELLDRYMNRATTGTMNAMQTARRALGGIHCINFRLNSTTRLDGLEGGAFSVMVLEFYFGDMRVQNLIRTVPRDSNKRGGSIHKL